MRIIVRSKGFRLWLPVPLSLAGAVVSVMPESAISEMRKQIPPPYQELVTRKLLRELVQECQSVLKQYRGLEIVHVEAQDGTFVSVRL